jgi:hypothetical protein
MPRGLALPGANPEVIPVLEPVLTLGLTPALAPPFPVKLLFALFALFVLLIVPPLLDVSAPLSVTLLVAEEVNAPFLPTGALLVAAAALNAGEKSLNFAPLLAPPTTAASGTLLLVV